MHDLDDKKPYVICLFLHYILLEMLQSTVLCCILQLIWIWNLFLRKPFTYWQFNVLKKTLRQKRPKKKYQKSITISVIENPIIHLSTYHKNTIPMSNLSVNDIGSGHLFFFCLPLYDGMTKRWNHDLPLVFKLQTRFPSFPFHFNEGNDYHTIY